MQMFYRVFLSIIWIFILGGCSQQLEGEQIYKKLCIACHTSGMFGAPKLGDENAWKPRIAQGMDTLFVHSINGFNKMPAKGGNTSLSDDEVKNAVIFMVSESQ